MRSSFRPVLVLGCFTLLIGTVVTRACPEGTTTQPAYAHASVPTHLLTLYNDKGDNKGAPPLQMRLWLPDDWETTGTAGRRQCADHDGEMKAGEMPAIIDFKIGHGDEKYPGYIDFDFTAWAWHQNFQIEKRRPNDDPKQPFEWSWYYAAIGPGGDPRTGANMSGHAVLEPYRSATTQPH